MDRQAHLVRHLHNSYNICKPESETDSEEKIEVGII